MQEFESYQDKTRLNREICFSQMNTILQADRTKEILKHYIQESSPRTLRPSLKEFINVHPYLLMP